MQTMGQGRPDGESAEGATDDVVGSEGDAGAPGGEVAADSATDVAVEAGAGARGDRRAAVGRSDVAAGGERDGGAASAEQVTAVLEELRALRSQVDALQPK
jgi:hypothetical protein